MNTAATLLLVMLSGEGYWISGRTETVQVQWNVKEPIAAATIAWRLVCGNAQLTSGRIVLPARQPAAMIQLILPEVRVPTDVQFVFRGEQPGGKAVAAGSLTAHVYPKDMLAGVAQRTKGKQLFIWDRPEGLPAVLKAAGVLHTIIGNDADLHFVRPDMIIVGPEQLGQGVKGQDKLLNLADAGTSVLLLRQTRPSRLAGYVIVRRASPAKLDWLAGHPMTQCLRLIGPQSIGPEAWALRLPADEPAQEIAWWPRETPGDQPAPIDALVLVKARNRGRIVFCQVPLGPWESDPRGQLFLAGALDYLASPMAPTLPPSRRPKPQSPPPAPRVPSIDFPQ